MSFIFDSTSTGSVELDQHIAIIQQIEWPAELGPLSSWPKDLLQLAHVMMLDPEPRLLLLGSENWMLYNLAYAKAVAGDRHPEIQGMTQVEAWSADIEASVIDAPNSVRKTGLSGSTHNYHVPLTRNGILEEVVLTWTLIPLAGNVNGVYVSLTDVTDAHVTERRRKTLSNIQKTCSKAKDLGTLWQAIPPSLASNLYDLPFALLYSLSYGPETPASHQLDLDSGLAFTLESFEGSFDPSMITSGQENRLLQDCPLARKALDSKKPVRIRSDEKDFPKAWLPAFNKQNVGNSAVICPLRSNTTEKVIGVLVMGLSARCPYNDAYRLFVSQIIQALTERITSLLLAEVENQKRAKARTEALERARASEKEASRFSEKLLRMQYIVEQVDVGIFELLPDGILVQSNDAYHKLSGVPKAHKGVEQLAFSAFLYPEDIESVMQHWAKMTSGTPTTFEMRWKAPLNKYGEDFQWVTAACIPLRDENGEVTSVYGCTTDIASQKRAETETRRRVEALERARVSEQRFYRFMEHAPVAIIISKRNGKLTYANSNWFKLCQYGRTEDYGNIDWASTIYSEDVELVARSQERMPLGEPQDMQFRLKALWHGGEGPAIQKWVMATAWPEIENGELKQVIITMTDISHLKFAEGVQRLRIEQAIEARRQQENFIDMTSHEIRNPLGAVVHCVDSIADSLAEMDALNKLLMDTPQQETAKQLQEYIDGSMDAANTIKSCTAHQKRIVDDILVLSKLDSNLLQIAPSCISAFTILKDIDKMFEAEASRECVNFITQADKSLEQMEVNWLMLDHGRINQIAINLITNALKFTKNRDTRNVTIRMGASAQRPSEADLNVNFDMDYSLGQSLRDSIYDAPGITENELYLWFAVEDTGRGMTPEEKSRIFARFQQGSPRTYSMYGGSGLGLYISHSLVGLQGGEIGVTTESGVGSTFSFFVKTSRCMPPEVKTLDLPHRLGGQASDEALATANRKATTAPRRVSILIVEDNLLNQRVLKKQLSKNYDVHTADQGQEALDFLKTSRHWQGQASSEINVDIILMDLEMPVMGGLQCVRTIRELQKSGEIRGHIPVIAVSANARPEQVKQAMEAGMDDAISKPFRIPDLLPKIDRLVDWTRASLWQ